MIEKLTALFAATDVLDLRKRTAEVFAAIGFDAAYYIAPLSAGRGSDRLMANAGFPDPWEEAYRNGGYRFDPLPDMALEAGRPIIWNRIPGRAQLTDEESAYLSNLERWGMQAGVGIVTYGPSARVGYVGVGLPKSPQIGEHPDLDLLRIAAQTSFTRYCELIEQEIDDLPGLSQREYDVLTRIARGKSKLAIADELGVSKDTVDTYFRRIYAKLDVSDRGAAVATAVARGILIATDMRISRAMLRRQPGNRNKDRPGR